MRWEVTYNTYGCPNQKMVVEANSSEEAKKKVEMIARAKNTGSNFYFSVMGVRTV